MTTTITSRQRGFRVASRVLAAVVGGLATAIAAAVCLALLVPDPRGLGLALGTMLLIPLWALAMCAGFLANSAWKAWLGFLGGAGVLAGLAAVLVR